MKPATLATIIFLVVVALAHLLRIVYAVPVMVGGFAVPMWMSAAATILTGLLATMLWRDAHR